MDLNNSFISTINLTITPYLPIIDSFELILLLSSVLITAIIVFRFNSTGLLHIHLLYFGKMCGIFFMISASFRFAIIVGKILGIGNIEHAVKTNNAPLYLNLDVDELFLIHGIPILTKIGVFGYFQLIRGALIISSVIMFAFMLYERFLATIMYKTYETWWNIFVVIIPIIITISLTVLLCFLTISGVSILYVVMPFIITYNIALVLLFGSYFYNLHKYKQSQQLQSYNLSHKFQLIENIRSIGLIWKAIFNVCGFLGSAAILFLLSKFIGNATLKYCCFIVFNYVMASVIILIIVTILITPAWRDLLFNKLRSFKKNLRRSSQVEDKNLALQQIKNLQGQRLVLPMNEEQNIYFQQLQASWK